MNTQLEIQMPAVPYVSQVLMFCYQLLKHDNCWQNLKMGVFHLYYREISELKNFKPDTVQYRFRCDSSAAGDIILSSGEMFKRLQLLAV